jgi:hypothetical protein
MQQNAIVVGTDGTPEHDSRVRDAARAARERSIPLHVVCSVAPITRLAQRALDHGLPADCAHLSGHTGQRNAAVADVHSLIGQSVPGVDLRVTASSLKLAAAERTLATQIGGEVYGAKRLRTGWLPVLRLRSRATA